VIIVQPFPNKPKIVIIVNNIASKYRATSVPRFAELLVTISIIFSIEIVLLGSKFSRSILDIPTNI
jgi:hypothetical protein